MKRGKEHAICLSISVRAAEVLAHFNPVFDQQGARCPSEFYWHSNKSWVYLTERKRPIDAQSSDCNCPVWFLSGPAEQCVHSRVDPTFWSLCLKAHFRALPLTHQSLFCTCQIPDILLGAGMCLLATPCGHQAYVKTLSQKPPSLDSKQMVAVLPYTFGLIKVQSKAN